MNICKECKYFLPQTEECIIDEHDVDLNDKSCDKFKKRKECKYRDEQCSESCTIICHRLPSECGCDFSYKCRYDGYLCDENCKIHQIRYEIEILKNEREKLYTAETAVKLAMARYSDKIIELNNKLEKLNKQIP